MKSTTCRVCGRRLSDPESVKRLILMVLAPLGDALATVTILLMLNGLAWVLGRVYLGTHYGLAVVYAAMGLLAILATLAYAVILLALSLVYQVPLGPIFIWPSRRVNLLQEARV